jgi:hypothetical protein
MNQLTFARCQCERIEGRYDPRRPSVAGLLAVTAFSVVRRNKLWKTSLDQ